MTSPIPALRAVDAVPVEIGDEEMVCLSDPEGYAGGDVVLSIGAFYLAVGMDGVRDLAGVLAFFRERTGAEAPEEQAVSLIEHLEQACFLDSPAFRARRDGIDREYREAHTRPAWFAGRAYPEEPEALRAYVDDCFTREGGPGPVDPSAMGSGTPVRCIVSPHIDMDRGGHSYAHAYRRLHAGGRPDRVIIFGVAHAPVETPFVLTRKDFATPLGVLRTDREAVERLAEAAGGDPFASEAAHRTEHSVEFQAVMLARLFGDGVRIVPVLCGHLGRGADGDGTGKTVGRVAAACRELAADPSLRTVVVAGADLSHVGRRFGDPVEITDRITEAVARADRAALKLLEAGEAAAFYAETMKNGNPRHVCGMGSIYAALESVRGLCGSVRLLHYDHAEDPAGGIVTFAALAAE